MLFAVSVNDDSIVKHDPRCHCVSQQPSGQDFDFSTFLPAVWSHCCSFCPPRSPGTGAPAKEKAFRYPSGTIDRDQKGLWKETSPFTGHCQQNIQTNQWTCWMLVCVRGGFLFYSSDCWQLHTGRSSITSSTPFRPYYKTLNRWTCYNLPSICYQWPGGVMTLCSSWWLVVNC